jgi:hypothetical protein
MRSKMIFGALLVSVALCSQGFGFELLDRMLGLNGGGCGECNACAKVAPCQPCAKVACEPKACLPACEPACEKAKVCRPTPVRDLFCNIKDLFEAKACQPAAVACEAPKCCPEPACARPVRCHKVRCERACKPCEPACKATCAPACTPVCEKPCKPKCHKLYRRPVLELLENLFGCNECGTCEVGGETGCATGCGGTAAPAGKTAPTTGPAKAPETTTPPPPVVPKPDPVTKNQTRGIYQASRSLARN